MLSNFTGLHQTIIFYLAYRISVRHGPFDILGGGGGGAGIFWKKNSLLWFWLKKNLLNGTVKKIICLQYCNQNSLIGWFETSKSKIFFWLASLARLLLTNLNYIYCPRDMLESTFKLVLHWLWSDILYTVLFHNQNDQLSWLNSSL